MQTLTHILMNPVADHQLQVSSTFVSRRLRPYLPFRASNGVVFTSAQSPTTICNMPHGTVVVLESEQYPFNHKRGYSVCETQNPGDTRTRVRQALVELRKSFDATQRTLKLRVAQ